MIDLVILVFAKMVILFYFYYFIYLFIFFFSKKIKKKIAHKLQEFHLDKSESEIEKINEELSKTKLCFSHFQSQECKKGCGMSHSFQFRDLTRQSNTFQIYKKSHLCWGWFFTGRCNSPICRLDHLLKISYFNFTATENFAQKNRSFRNFVKDYQKGICKVFLVQGSCNNEGCSFRHPQHLRLSSFSQTNQFHYKK